jgi:endonuclease/exonuclease/phosphatase family metal-dependent hydrolase
MRVLIWNLFHGRAVPPAGRPLERAFAERIASWEWDLALLQEVPPWWPPALAHAAGAEARSALTSRNEGLALRRAIATRRPDLIKSNGGGANAILARVPIASHESIRLRRWPERRVLQLARLGDGTSVANYHASTVPKLAREELERAWTLALDWAGDSPLIFGGDLNLSDPSAPLVEIAHVAASHVDHLFVRGFEPQCEPVKPDRGGLSDHAALIVGVG